MNGHSVPTSQDGFPVLRLTALRDGRIDLAERKLGQWTREEALGYLVREGDFLIARGNGSLHLVGRGGLVGPVVEEVAFPDTMIRARLRPELLAPGFLRYQWESTTVRHQIERTARTTAGIYKVNQRDLGAVQLVLAPVRQQRRIVAEIEKQFTRLDEAVATLKAVQAKLKRARASVLKAAVEGRLVPTEAELARAESRSYEPASILLERIVAERRARWPKGKKYQPPAERKRGALPAMPDGWSAVTVDQLSSRVTKGTTPTSVGHQFTEEGVLFVKVESLAGGRIVHDQCARISEEANAALARSQLASSDVLISIAGTLGRVAVVRPSDVPANTNQAVAIIRLVEPAVAPFLLHALASDVARTQVSRDSRGVGLQNLNLQQVASLTVPLPSLDEQTRIVAEVERRLSVLDNLEHTVEQSLTRCGCLRQSILKRAFEGKLVPQDPNDEPASELLARIRAQRSNEARA